MGTMGQSANQAFSIDVAQMRVVLAQADFEAMNIICDAAWCLRDQALATLNAELLALELALYGMW